MKLGDVHNTAVVQDGGLVAYDYIGLLGGH